MNMMTRTLSGLAMAGLAAAFAPGAAFAQDADAALARLKQELAKQGTTLAWTSENAFKDADGNQAVSLSGVTVEVDGNTVPVDSGVELHGITDDGKGGYTIGELSVPHFSYADKDSAVELDAISMTNLHLPADGDESGPLGGMMMYDSAALGGMTLHIHDKQVFTMNDLHFEVTPPEDGDPMEFTGAAESFKVDLSALQDPKARAIAAALGYSELDGDGEIAGSWQPDDGLITLDHYEVSIKDAGTIGISLEIGGYTPEFVKSLRQMQAQAAANQGKDNSAMGMAMLGLMQQLSFRNASIYFIDDSLTQKVLQFVASQQGVKPSDIANQAKAMVPFMMMQLNDPDLSSQTSEAVSTFLDDPQNIEVDAEPEKPVPFAMIMAAAMSAPKSLPKQLGVTVDANTDQ